MDWKTTLLSSFLTFIGGAVLLVFHPCLLRLGNLLLAKLEKSKKAIPSWGISLIRNLPNYLFFSLIIFCTLSVVLHKGKEAFRQEFLDAQIVELFDCSVSEKKSIAMYTEVKNERPEDGYSLSEKLYVIQLGHVPEKSTLDILITDEFGTQAVKEFIQPVDNVLSFFTKKQVGSMSVPVSIKVRYLKHSDRRLNLYSIEDLKRELASMAGNNKIGSLSEVQDIVKNFSYKKVS